MQLLLNSSGLKERAEAYTMSFLVHKGNGRPSLVNRSAIELPVSLVVNAQSSGAPHFR